MPKQISKRAAVLFGCLSLFSIAQPNQAIGSSESESGKSAKFERDLESLFGAAIATKHGDMTIRQRKDSGGRVRKQIIVGPTFSEIQLDQDGDGTVDFWEIKSGEKTVSASEPNRGRFLRMNVSERAKDGTLEATYILDPNGRTYNLLRTEFSSADRRMYSDSAPDSFEASNVPAASPAFMPLETPTEGAGTNQPKRDERFELEDQSWREYQSRYIGSDLVCLSDESTSGRLAGLQRDWWRILKYDVDGRVDRLTDKLKESKMFDSSCRDSRYKNDFDKIAKSLAELMMTSSKGEPYLGRQSGGFLRCLEQSGLGTTAAKIEQNFLSGLNSEYRAERAIACDFKPGAAGLARPGQTTESKQVILHMCLKDEEKETARTADGSVQTYKNVLFHELIHAADVRSEELTHAAQACCGEKSKDQAGSCEKLDRLVAAEQRYAQLETYMSRDGTIVPILAELNAKFGATGTADLYRNFLLGLDKYKRGPPPAGVFESGLISNEEFSKCLKSSSEKECLDQWTKHIENFTDEFFKRECRKHAGAARSQCGKLTSDFKKRLANTIANSMIQTKSEVDNNEPKQCRVDSGKTSVARNAFRFFQRLFSAANAVEDDCATGINIPQAPAVDLGRKSPTFSVPGAGDTDTVVSRPGGDSSIVTRPSAPTQPIRFPNGSPLPVTRVTSPDSGRSVAERSYERVTNIAGLTTGGLKALRASIVPRAIAADRSGNNSKRLNGDEPFIAFRAPKSEGKALKVDNPFAANRSAASLVLPKGGSALISKSSVSPTDSGANPAKGSGAGEGPSIPGASFANNPGGSTLNQSVPKGGGGQKANSENPNIASQATTKNGIPDTSGAQASLAKSPPNREPAEVLALLDGLFTRKYRLIENRLNDLTLQQNLIDRGIKIIGADGRLIGAKNTVKTCYKYVGQEQPLKTPCEN